MNNDGFNGNDLIYIPENQGDILLGTVTTASGVTTYTPAAQSMYDDCLHLLTITSTYLKIKEQCLKETNPVTHGQMFLM